MTRGIPIRTESARYATPLLLLPELWAPARVWQPAADYLGHRGWEGEMLELRGAGGLAARTALVIDRVRLLGRRPAIVGHGAGALVAAEVARAGAAAAVVLVAPLTPRSRTVRALIRRWGALAAIARGRPVPPPLGPDGRRLFLEQPVGLEAEAGRAVLDAVRGCVPLHGPLGVPTLLVAGERDPLLDPAASTGLATDLGAEHAQIVGAGHWPILPPAWQQTVAVVHRWLVQRLGEPLLEFYAEAMAERDAEDEGPSER
jgi:pimeloyl-ACP methyl ester carboxylesterase